MFRLTKPLLAIIALVAVAGCGDDATPPVVLYTSVDEPYSRPLVDAFTRETGIEVRLVTDTEANKSVGLAERLRAEKDRPAADVWWGNEPFLTVRLADEGLFEPFSPPSASEVREQYRDADNRWVGNGLRARGVAVQAFEGEGDARIDLDLEAPSNLDKLADFASSSAMARPTAGTTASHVAALYVLLGQSKADDYFRTLGQSGIRLVAGNSQAAAAAAGAGVDFGLTDNDDVANFNANHSDRGLSFVLLDQAEGEIGTLAIPTTIALVRRDREPAELASAQRLADYLASSRTERSLLDAKFALASVRGGDVGLRAMEVDYAEVARAMPEAVRRASALLEGREP